mgnify:CR=1 FL=1|tara:strand:+ start:650 stop:877 length:228 start_codon:yes stop_codon:yes gene_type:complete
MVWRLSEELIDIDNVCVYQCPSTESFSLLNGGELNYMQLQQLILFLDKESKSSQLRFEKYVDKIIEKLIYKKDEH